MGPMRAAADFARTLEAKGELARVARVQAELYGSLALTGHGHGTDRAILLGLSGELPDAIEPETIEPKLAVIRAEKKLKLAGTKEIAFKEATDLLWHKDKTLAAHSNGMRFTAYNANDAVIATQVYFSIGGGFILREGESAAAKVVKPVPFVFSSSDELLRIGDERGLAIWQIALENEKAWHTEAEIRAHVARIWSVMQECVKRGLETDGILPGGLNVRRRAPRSAKKLAAEKKDDALAPMDWVNTFAMAVNEENAAGGRVVTAPTNGAAGIIPAVAHYYMRFVPEATEEGLFRYFLTASVIGVLYKENASISGAEVGCQGEVGVACSMAAGALAAVMGGTPKQVENAAEIGMEHNLGLTCDPVGGMVQIPCIERNAMAAVKAVNAARMALRGDGSHYVSLDSVIKTMRETGADMKTKYKETSRGGLAVNIVEC
jgi:L-serine dehydratase